ncbi:MAG: hypothetical protein Ct9H300mP32_0830 [Verrucomicrobiota bacterium]|nr:MAG: hypothetical protein Ct9H300mP32_0830 [Verrucomicrobiota bacterium]
MIEGMGYVGTPFDHAVSAFIEDVEARGCATKFYSSAVVRWAARPR